MGIRHHLTVTVGVAERSNSMHEISELVDAADSRLLNGKRARRNGGESARQLIVTRAK
jgi:PleD family two-component response regulator